MCLFNAKEKMDIRKVYGVRIKVVQKMKSRVRILILGIAFVVVSIFIFNFYKSDATHRQISRNTQAFNERIINLEPIQTVTLAEIIPFEWDYLYIFGAYQRAEYMLRTMRLERYYIRYILDGGNHDGAINLYFLMEGVLVARIIDPWDYVIDFSRGNQIIASSDNREVFVDIHIRGGRELIRISLLN